MDSLCHPWFTSTHLSYRFPILKRPHRLVRYYWYYLRCLVVWPALHIFKCRWDVTGYFSIFPIINYFHIFPYEWQTKSYMISYGSGGKNVRSPHTLRELSSPTSVAQKRAEDCITALKLTTSLCKPLWTISLVRLRGFFAVPAEHELSESWKTSQVPCSCSKMH